MISIIIGHFDYKHRCLVEKNVPTAFILPSRWQDGTYSLAVYDCILGQTFNPFLMHLSTKSIFLHYTNDNTLRFVDD